MAFVSHSVRFRNFHKPPEMACTMLQFAVNRVVFFELSKPPWVVSNHAVTPVTLLEFVHLLGLYSFAKRPKASILAKSFRWRAGTLYKNWRHGMHSMIERRRSMTVVLFRISRKKSFQSRLRLLRMIFMRMIFEF